jgi:magnesium transporter
MLLTHGSCPDHGDRLVLRALAAGDAIPEGTVWIDLLNPSAGEDRLIEQHLGISIPTREEMHDLEPSEIIYSENGAHYMTARIICQSDTAVPKLADVTFILTATALVTVRYDEPGAFGVFLNRIAKPGGCGANAQSVLEGLFEAIIDRAAEVLRGVGDRIDDGSRRIFDGKSADVEQGNAYQGVIQKIGQHEHIISNVRESMVSVERVLLFLSANYKRPKKAGKGFTGEWRSTIRDVQAIEEHATFLSNKLQFMMDATLGLVSIEQNKIIKLFSVVSVALMPPTLIASIYGMNFKVLPELEWQHGYPLAIGLMVLCAVLPYLFFRWKKWL